MITQTTYSEDTLDDLMQVVLRQLLNDTDEIEASRSSDLGPFTEIPGATLELRNPRARLSRSDSKGKVFSALGEFLWYMSGTNDYGFISHYIRTGYEKEAVDGVVPSGYGDRLFSKYGLNQIEKVIEKLRGKRTTRQAVIQIYAADDLSHRYVPCTCTLQFLIRNDQLHLFVNMRSNDAFWGLPHDVFAFTMIQELIARHLGVELGTYKQFVGSLHLYKKHRPDAQTYIDEGYQNILTTMPPMPSGEQLGSLEIVKRIEERIRVHEDYDLSQIKGQNYWFDICVMLAIYKRLKLNKNDRCEDLSCSLTCDYYDMFVDRRING